MPTSRQPSMSREPSTAPMIMPTRRESAERRQESGAGSPAGVSAGPLREGEQGSPGGSGPWDTQRGSYPSSACFSQGLPGRPQEEPYTRMAMGRQNPLAPNTAPPSGSQGPHCTHLRPSPPPHTHCSPRGWPPCTDRAHHPRGRRPSGAGLRCSDLKLREHQRLERGPGPAV